jgi:hypothetical protein
MNERQPVPRVEDFRAHFEVEVRFRDLNAFGHVNNAVYATYFEGARLGYVRAIGHAGRRGGPARDGSRPVAGRDPQGASRQPRRQR